MENNILTATSQVKAWTTRVSPGKAEDFMKEVSEAGRESGSELLVLKGNLVFGSDHIRSAYYHARKAIDEGRNASDSVTMETLLYSSGERQLSSAIKKMSVDKGTETVAIVSLGVRALNPGHDWKEMPMIPSTVDIADLKVFGILDSELETVSRDKAVELVLEKVAAVDVLKK
jgi:tRNA threonylcarbamoyladenosine modification (KEOPS) complex Cgi121 subunit